MNSFATPPTLHPSISQFRSSERINATTSNRRQVLVVIALFVSLLWGCATEKARADVVTLYDDGLPTAPGDQAWLVYVPLGSVTQSTVAAGTQLTTDTSAQAGYSNYNPFPPTLKNLSFPSLDRTTGFSLSFEMQLLAESHISNDRAGFSVIALANDARGIELGFWEDRAFAQTDTPLFTHGEEGFFDTTDAETSYLLTIQNDGYVLTADAQEILSGPLRDYSDFSGPLGPIPYNLDNYLFLGDNTMSAGADVVLGSVRVTTGLIAVPEPTSGFFLGLVAMSAAATCRRRQ